MKINLPELTVRILPTRDEEDIRILLFQGNDHERDNLLADLWLGKLLAEYYDVSKITGDGQVSYERRMRRKKQCIASLKRVINDMENHL